MIRGLIIRVLVFLPLFFFIGAVAGFLYGLDTDLMVPLGTVGVIGIVAATIKDWRMEGFEPSHLTIGAWGLMMLCGVPIYYFGENSIVLFTFFGLALLFVILMFAGKIWEQTRKTKMVIADYKAEKLKKETSAIYTPPTFKERLKRSLRAI